MDQHPMTEVMTGSPVGHLYTTAQVAKMLQVSQHTVQVWIRDGHLPAVRYGRLLRVRATDLANFGEVLSGHTAPEESPTPASVGQE